MPRSWASGSSFAASSRPQQEPEAAGWRWRKGPIRLPKSTPAWRMSDWSRSQRLSYWDTYRLKPIPPALEKVRGVHPRIYLTSERIEKLRAAIKTTHAAIWKKVRDQADRAVRQGPPAYMLHDRQSGDEQLWQREVGNAMPLLAMAYVLTGEKQYLDAARRWALASCGYKTWGLGRIDGMDLATGHQLFGLAIVYDWCYRDLDEAARRQIRETLVKRTSAMFEAAATGKAWWHRSYLQNHLWVNITGMAASGIALFDEVDDAACWIGLPLDKYRRTMAALGPDGASHEGVGYWEYGVEYMLKFMDLARPAARRGSLRLSVVAQHGRLRPISRVAEELLDARKLHRGHRRLPAQPLVWPGVSAAGTGAAVS